MIQQARETLSYNYLADLIRELGSLYQRAGVALTIFSRSPDARSRFESRPFEVKSVIIKKTEDDISLFQDILAQGMRIDENQDAVSRFCFRNSLKIPGSVLELINNDCVIELYDETLMQRFRSVNFFSHTSHTLEDLQTLPYFDLFRKKADVELVILDRVKAILRGEVKEPDFVFIGDHKLWEINSSRKIVTNLRPVAVSQMLDADDGSVAGFIHICKVLDQRELSLLQADTLPPPVSIDPSTISLSTAE